MKKLLSALLGISLLIGTVSLAPAGQPVVKIANKDGVGHYLTDAKGMTLYWFKMDSSGKSTCNGDCLEKWPPYFSETVAPPSGIDSKDFGTISRSDGKKQTAFRGFPLYYFFKDANPGDTNGQGVKDVWYVIDPAMFPSK
jgi:predicted lipoprotein with Yx(FWY)xxD motif